MNNADIYRSARILVEEHGPGALSFAAKRAAGFAMEGDDAQAAIWKRIVDALRELQRLAPDHGKALH